MWGLFEAPEEREAVVNGELVGDVAADADE